MAALSAGAGYPASLRSMLTVVEPHRPSIVDLGCGAGGASEWMRHRNGAAAVFAVDPSSGATGVAAAAFPDLWVARAPLSRTGLSSDLGDVVACCGVLSLVDDVVAVLDEACRLLRPDGVLAIADVFPTGADDVIVGRNCFLAFETLESLLEERGLSVVHVGCGDPSLTPSWSAVSDAVDAWIEEHRRDDPAFPEWQQDRHRLAELLTGGDLIAGCVVATPAL